LVEENGGALPKKKSIKLAAQNFIAAAAETEAYVAAARQQLSDAQVSRVYDGAVISLYRDFENLILEVLVGAINGVSFPRHLTDAVCRYMITGPSYFDFKGRDGLIKRVKQYVPANHYLLPVLRDQKYKVPLERLCTLRNLAAHGSPQSKKAALEAVGQKRIGSAGSWLKCQGRFSLLIGKLRQLAQDIDAVAPY
jgi:hypothetical protein